MNTTVLPATSAPPAGPAASASGKLNGEMTAQTPYGRRTLEFSSPGPSDAERRLESVVLCHLVAVVVDQVGRLFDVADALETVLAGLVPHQRRRVPTG